MKVKCSTDELFMHYVQKIRQLLRDSPQTRFGAPFMGPAGARKP